METAPSPSGLSAEQCRGDVVWQNGDLVRTFLDGVRGGIPFAAEQIEVMLRVVGTRAVPVAAFLDLGCGSGVLAAALRGRYPRAEATLVDFSEPMLAAARASLGAFRPEPQFVLADFGVPTWVTAIDDRAPFDAVVSGYAIHHQPDGRKRALYGEIFELMAPGGVFVNIEHVASVSPWGAALADEAFVDALADFHVRAGTGLGRAEVAARYVHRPDKAANILAPVETQCAWLREIGFVDVDCWFKHFELAVFGGRRL